MSQKEIKDISLSLTLMMEGIVNPMYNETDVANLAISFTKDLLTNYPKIRAEVDEMFSIDDNNYIHWIHYEEEMLP